MRALALGVIKLYQLAARPFLPPRCRFYPSCSDYAAEAVGAFGLWRASALTLARLLRCHPFHPGGYDPLIKHG